MSGYPPAAVARRHGPPALHPHVLVATPHHDEFTARAFPDYPGGTALARYHRELLRDAMEAHGFTVYEAEWWHFDYKEWREYPIMNVEFGEIATGINTEGAE